jgi:CRP/FNR family transcriptional regulator, cyclic AMP receptor protein
MNVAADSRINKPEIKLKKKNAFTAQGFLDSVGLTKRIAKFRRSQRIYSQGDPASNVLYIQQGGVKLSVVNAFGKEAVVAILGPGDFLGEGSIVYQSVRISTATAITPTILLAIEKDEMVRALHTEHEFSDHFISYMVSRNTRTEEALIDQLFNSSEKRLARALLLLTQYGRRDEPLKWLPKISQEMLAEMIGTTRTRVTFFMTKFRKLGFIGYEGGLHVNPSLLSVILHE